MCIKIIIKALINQLIRVKHIIIFLSKCRLFRRYGIYLLMSFIILIIQLILAINFYSSYTSSLESKVHNKFPVYEKNKKIEPNHESVEYEENDNSLSNAIDNKSKDLTQTRNYKKILNFNELKINSLCNISGKYAVSAIQRASTNKCKQQLADITCLSQSSQLYPKSLPRYCPLNDGHFGDYVGCYRDRAKPRVLTGYKTKFIDNSPVKCLNICLQSGFRFAGLQFKNECFCGGELPPQSSKLQAFHCNMSCSGSPNHLCGGYFAIDIYRTGLPKMPKVTPSLVSHTTSETSVRIVFLLTVNGRPLRQIKRLIKNLYDSKHYYYIHVDSRQDYLYRELSELETKFKNIKLSRLRLSTIWGGASLLQMLLNCISDILQFPDWTNSWDFVINISETDFPIKSINELENFLAVNKGKNFVKSHGQDAQRFIAKQGLDKTFYECDTHMWRVADRELPTGIRWDGGSDWVVLSREFCNYVTFNDNQLLRGLKTIFKYTLLPAESYFHTVLQNSEFCSTIIDNNLRLTNWRRKQGCKCQYKHIVDWCGCSPNDFKTNDWTRLAATQTKPLFFGRKFEPVVNQNIINKLEELISKKSNENRVANDKYWQNEYHFKDSQPIIDDTKLTFYHSFAINTLKSIEEKCELRENLLQQNFSHTSHAKLLQISRVNEANLYFESDIFQGILISFESIANDGINSRLTFETIVRPINHVIFHSSNSLAEKLLALQVCSDFDVKELIFRNLGCVLGPFSKPVAMHKWIPSSETFSTTFIWIDPINIVAGSYDVKIESNGSTDISSNIMIQKPLLNGPLRPGVWKLLVLHNWQMIAETRFLISPLLFYNQTQVNKDYAKILHNGPKHYSSHNFSSIEAFLGYHNKSLGIEIGLKNCSKFGKDLVYWINSLYSEFWYSHEMCYISEATSLSIHLNCHFQMIPCHLTDWSSFSPDPKSDISSTF